MVVAVAVAVVVRVSMLTVRMPYMVTDGIQLDLIVIDTMCPLICIHT
jgi:hypothetical protein